jgi:hypothetical protein
MVKIYCMADHSEATKPLTKEPETDLESLRKRRMELAQEVETKTAELIRVRKAVKEAEKHEKKMKEILG